MSPENNRTNTGPVTDTVNSGGGTGNYGDTIVSLLQEADISPPEFIQCWKAGLQQNYSGCAVSFRDGHATLDRQLVSMGTGQKSLIGNT